MNPEVFVVTDSRTTLQASLAPEQSLGELLRDRALSSSARLLVAQAGAGAALNVAVMLWHPNRWGIATATVAAMVLHALWSVAVQRTDEAVASIATDGDPPAHAAERAAPTIWWHIRRASAIGASGSALIAFWFACMMLLGRLMS